MFDAILVAAWFLTIVGFLIFLRQRERAVEQERSQLLFRVQAPERAVAAQAHREGADEERRRYVPVALDDDVAMARAHGEEIEEDDDGGS